MRYVTVLFICLIFFISCTSNAGEITEDRMLPSLDSAKYIKADGMLLRGPEGQFLIRGIAFGNSVWGNPANADDFTHHSMSDYANIKDMGFNSVRFYINYGLFESDSRPYRYKESGFDWLDKNIAAARENGIYLILNMHYPQGGFQSGGSGDALWNNRENQKRLIALWREIALRYRDETQILGYGPVNEPVPVEGLSQWEGLLQEIIYAIREVDRQHIIFAERAIYTKGRASEVEMERHLFPAGIEDPGDNLVYEFHMYEPMPFTHQNASWTRYKGQFATYPDNTRIELKDARWAGSTLVNRDAPAGTYDWTPYEGELFTVHNTDFLAGRACFQAQGLGSGAAWCDDIEIEEFDVEGNPLGVIWQSSLDNEGGWSFWSKNGSGEYGYSDDTRSGESSGSIQIKGTTDDANVTQYSRGIPVTRGHSYRIRGWIKGQRIPDSAMVRLRVDFYTGNGLHSWNKEYLESVVQDHIAFGAEKNAPVYLGEFGLMNDAYTEDRGGDEWIRDMLEILTAHDVNYNYHTYHEPAFGVYSNSEGYPDPAYVNEVLVETFREMQIGE